MSTEPGYLVEAENFALASAPAGPPSISCIPGQLAVPSITVPETFETVSAHWLLPLWHCRIFPPVQ